jgi:hypothetical protein
MSRRWPACWRRWKGFTRDRDRNVIRLGRDAIRLGRAAIRLGRAAIQSGRAAIRLGRDARRSGRDAIRLGRATDWKSEAGKCPASRGRKIKSDAAARYCLNVASTAGFFQPRISNPWLCLNPWPVPIRGPFLAQNPKWARMPRSQSERGVNRDYEKRPLTPSLGDRKCRNSLRSQFWLPRIGAGGPFRASRSFSPQIVYTKTVLTPNLALWNLSLRIL